ncbi:hypothetical protein PRIPAC_78163 [Pristionchus pacificus]|uniref:Uncharacterized protein n=1 Tax=Pristionchus pacificus TaxID=54126 RepID=A0A2A6CMM9_PRIPA|nr:hypothetical protein PRIPAC_78163 [Pristionchus pacificus]|eukprot:PDM79369.1 hypothetical protein PRIPAC_31948 [Pristionchus pacificus]
MPPMSLPKPSPSAPMPPLPRSHFSAWCSAAPDLLTDWFRHPRTLGAAPKTLAMAYMGGAGAMAAFELAHCMFMGHLGENIVASLLELIVLVAAGVGCWAMAKRKPLGLTPFLVTVVLCILFTIVIWFADHVPQSVYKSDEFIALGAIVYLHLHCLRTVLCARRIIVEDIKNEIYGRF